MATDYSKMSYAGLIEVRDYLKGHDTSGPYNVVLQEIRKRFPTLNTVSKNTIKSYYYDKSKTTVHFNRLYQIKYSFVLKHLIWLSLSVGFSFLYFSYIKQDVPLSFYPIMILLSTIYPVFWIIVNHSRNLAYDVSMKRFYYKDFSLVTEFGFDDIEFCETGIIKGFESLQRNRFRKRKGGLGLAIQITLVDKQKISVPNTIHNKDAVVQHLLSVCGLEKKRI